MSSGSDHPEPGATDDSGSALPTIRRRPRWMPRTLLGFAFVVLLALALIPVVVNSRIEPHRDVITDVAEPATNLTRDIQLALAREMAALRGYLITGEPRYLDRYEELKTVEDAVFPRLDSLAVALGPQAQRKVDTLRSAVDRWGRWVSGSGLLERGWASDEYFERASLEQGMYEAALQASLELENEIEAALRRTRRRIERLESIGTWISRGLILVALAAMGGVAWVGRELRELNETLDRRAREEQGLRREADEARAEALDRARDERTLRKAAERVSAAYTPDEIASSIADSALRATGADRSIVKCVDSETGDVDVLATSGERLPEEGGAGDRGDASNLEFVPGGCEKCPAVVVRLGEPPGPFGALVLLRRPKRPPFSDDEVGRARIFGEIATLAFRKIHLLATAEARRTELERVTESRSRLIRGFSHDLKNPLGAADAHAALLESEIKGSLNPEQKESLSRIRATIRSAFDLIDELVELGRVEAGQLRVQLEAVKVSEVAAEVAEEYRAQADAAGLDLRVEIPPDVPEVRTDPQRLHQVLGNLLSNAVKYTSSGAVTLRVRPRPEPADGTEPRVDLEVRDTGAGIPEEKLGLLFQEFSRLDATGTPGAGLGLAISRRIARMLGGEITVETEVGVGSTFILTLPLAPNVESTRRA